MPKKRLTPVARKLRGASTDVENGLWQRVRSRQIEGAKCVRQCPIAQYVVDFACRSARLVIELDGGQHADSAADAERTGAIEAHGYTVLRFWNNDVIENMSGVLEEIRSTILLARP